MEKTALSTSESRTEAMYMQKTWSSIEQDEVGNYSRVI